MKLKYLIAIFIAFVSLIAALVVFVQKAVERGVRNALAIIPPSQEEKIEKPALSSEELAEKILKIEVGELSDQVRAAYFLRLEENEVKGPMRADFAKFLNKAKTLSLEESKKFHEWALEYFQTWKHYPRRPGIEGHYPDF